MSSAASPHQKPSPRLTLRLMSLGDVFFEGPVVWVSFFALDGAIQVRPKHAPLLTTLKPGVISFMPTSSSKPRFFKASEGIADIKPDVVTLFSGNFSEATHKAHKPGTQFVWPDRPFA